MGKQYKAAVYIRLAKEEQPSEVDRGGMDRALGNDLSLINPFEAQSFRDMLDRRILAQQCGKGDSNLYSHSNGLPDISNMVRQACLKKT